MEICLTNSEDPVPNIHPVQSLVQSFSKLSNLMQNLDKLLVDRAVDQTTHDPTVAQIFGEDNDDIDLIVASAARNNVQQQSNNLKPNEDTLKNADKSELQKLEADLENLFELHKISISFPIPCDFCEKTFTDFEEFDVHILSHRESRFFSCQLCPSTYVSWGNLVAHRKASHRGKMLSCTSCRKRCYHPGLGPVNYPVSGFPIGCEECQAGFTTIVQLYRHYRCHSKQRANGANSEELELPSGIGLYGPPPPDSHRCQICKKEFLNDEQLRAHTAQLQHNDGSNTCSICGRKFCDARTLALHKRRHPDAVVKSFMCSQCGRVLRDRASYQRHKIIHNSEKPFRCTSCPKSFNRKSILSFHMYLHPAREDYRCFNCKMSFIDTKELKDHLKQTHQHDSSLVCDICQSVFSVKSLLKHYMSCHSARKARSGPQRRINLTCPICQKLFSQPSILHRHLLLHNPTLKKGHKCDICGKTVLRKANIPAHIRAHFGNDDNRIPIRYRPLLETKQHNKPPQKCFTCEYCGREFRKAIHMKVHVRWHTGEKPYRCELCDKAFYTNQQLVIHVRRHTGERPYQCTACNKSFAGPTALYAHRKVHSKVKRYNCPHCNKEFFWRSEFISHVRRHTTDRPYVCSICDKSFTLKGKLNLHMKKHETDHQLFRCSDCGDSFLMEQELARHIKNQGCDASAV